MALVNIQFGSMLRVATNDIIGNAEEEGGEGEA